ncbi:Protein of unknown function [Weissella confusa LBAE C39-2]|nr:Protein of unknown function [Weissella confusa LBAE C39-2]
MHQPSALLAVGRFGELIIPMNR